MYVRASFVGGSWCDCRFLLLQNNLHLSSFTSLQLGSLYKAHTNRSIFVKSSSFGGNLSPKLLTTCLRAGFNCTISSPFFFPLVEKALTLSQPVMACRLGSTSDTHNARSTFIATDQCYVSSNDSLVIASQNFYICIRRPYSNVLMSILRSMI